MTWQGLHCHADDAASHEQTIDGPPFREGQGDDQTDIGTARNYETIEVGDGAAPEVRRHEHPAEAAQEAVQEVGEERNGRGNNQAAQDREFSFTELIGLDGPFRLLWENALTVLVTIWCPALALLPYDTNIAPT